MAPTKATGVEATEPDDERATARRVGRIRRRLITWGREHFADYAWRSESDPWLSLVAEMLVQRTRASQAERVFRSFREHFPTAAALVAAGPSVATELTKQTGLHWRGPLIYQAAVEVARRGGAPPDELDALLDLPGVGHYVAAAWLSLHRQTRAVVIDSNVARWLSRLEGLPYDSEVRRARWVADLADRITPQQGFRDFNYAVLDFTMQVCVPGRPHCNQCPILRDCHFGTSKIDPHTPSKQT